MGWTLRDEVGLWDLGALDIGQSPAVLFLGCCGLGGVEFGQVFGGVFLEFTGALLAAEFNQAIRFTLLFVNVVDRGAHVVEAFARDDAGVERVGSGGAIGGLETGGGETEK